MNLKETACELLTSCLQGLQQHNEQKDFKSAEYLFFKRCLLVNLDYLEKNCEEI